MNVAELYELLGELMANGELNPEAELRFCYRRHYPLQDLIRGVHQAERADRVYLVSGGQDPREPYAPSEPWDDCTEHFNPQPGGAVARVVQDLDIPMPFRNGE